MRDDDLDPIDEQRRQGALTAEQAQREQEGLLRMRGTRYAGMRRETFCAMLHVSHLACFAAPLLALTLPVLVSVELSLAVYLAVAAAGLALPLAAWALYRHRDPMIDAHGRVVLAWLISAMVYAVVCAALSVIFVGVLLGTLLLGAHIAASVFGAVQASQGRLWRYPLTLPFLRLPPRLERAFARRRA